MLLFTVVSAAQITAISVAKDMTEGIIARFKTMRIWRPAVLAGHVFSSLVLTLISLAVTIAVALLIGYDAAVSPLGWLAALGVLVLLAVALLWLSVALGLLARSVETASNTPMVLTLLVFLGSSFVPVASMPAGLRWFAENQPFTRSRTPCAACSPTSTSAAPASRRSCGASRSPPPAVYGPGISTTADPSSRHHPVNFAGVALSAVDVGFRR
jgi:ABC-type multidrug transport system permease subunit